VFEEDCQRCLCVERGRRREGGGGGVRSNNNANYSYAGGLYILVHGRATITRAGRSLIVHNGGENGVGGASNQSRKVLGRLSAPFSEETHEFFKRAPETEANGSSEGTERQQSLYHRFVSPDNLLRSDDDDVTIRFEKGSSYIVLPESSSRCFLDRLNASLIAKRVLNDIGIAGLLSKKRTAHERDCTRQISLAMDGESNKATKVFRYRAGQILIKEGDIPDDVLFLATGSCLILRYNGDGESHCVGSIVSPCFIGIAALFGHDYGGCGGLGSNMNDSAQPVSVVAATDGHAFSFCSLCFRTSVEKASSKLVNAFQFLARSQMEAWATHSAVEEEEEENKGRGGEDALTTASDDDVKEEEEIVLPKAINIQQSSVTENLKVQMEESSNENSVNTNALNKTLEESIYVDANLSKGKLNRSKFLSLIHETLSKDLTTDATKNDMVHNREKWQIEDNKDNILSDITKALSEGCGVDVRDCEGSDPFHDFVVDKSAEDATSAGDDYSMSLQLPTRMPNRVRKMADKCLGRKRPPEYDDSDPFLKPCPSVVSRRMHGKTLPMVRRISFQEKGVELDVSM